jgi:hypothetical protein
MIINKILKVVLLLLGGIFIILQGFAYEVKGAAVSAFTLLLFTIFYYRLTKSITKYFFWFLVLFTIAQLLSYAAYYTVIDYEQMDYYYYGANSLYILAYVLLIIKMLRGFDLKTVFLEFPIPLVILVALDIFCVSIVTDTTENVLSIYEYSLEFGYNTVIMSLLSVALINYMYRNDNKSMLFLIGSICIVFSEIIQLAYHYILPDDSTLGSTYSFFLVMAFVFFYLQSQVEYTGPEPEFIDEQLEV